VAFYTGAVMRSLADGGIAPPVPDEVDPVLAPRLQVVRDELITLVETYRSAVEG
jgi:hypothetical protein